LTPLARRSARPARDMDNATLKSEADTLLARAELRAALPTEAVWFIGGSYAYDLMAWRDLDVYVLDPAADLPRSFAVAAHVTARLGALKARFTDSRGGQPDGLYWGIRLGDSRRGAWKLDLWFLRPASYEQHQHYAAAMRARLTPELSGTILALKARYWTRPEYRDTITSHDLYEAVLTHGARNEVEFEEYLRTRRRSDGP
jgi:hypothetical protein